jgi:hypothetical protein
MLSYLRDANQTPAAAQMQEQASVSPGEESASGSDRYLKPAAHARNLRQGTIILVILFVAGAAGVWWMIKKSGLSAAQGASEEEASQIDKALAQLTSFQAEINSQMDSVASRFSQASELGQITVADLKKNPFRQEYVLDQSDEDPSENQTLMRKEEMQRRAGLLKLWSITARQTNSCCMINDKVLYVGDSIQGFVVKEILSDRVRIAYEDIVVELKTEE